MSQFPSVEEVSRVKCSQVLSKEVNPENEEIELAITALMDYGLLLAGSIRSLIFFIMKRFSKMT